MHRGHRLVAYRSNTLHLFPQTQNLRGSRHRQPWIVGFSEEEVFKTEGGRLISGETAPFYPCSICHPLDYASADLPFNLWRFHFFACTANVYFAPAPDSHFADNLRYEKPLVSYVGRCRNQRDEWVPQLALFRWF